MLGTYDVWIGDDFGAAEKAWGELVADAPKDKEALTFRTWWAYSLLKEYKNAEALDAVKDQPVDRQAARARLRDRVGEVAHRRQRGRVAGDRSPPTRAGARATGKSSTATLMVFAGRTNASLADATAALVDGKSKVEQYDVLAKLGLQAYQFAGRWTDGVAAIEKAFAVAGTTVPVSDRAGAALQRGRLHRAA